MFLQPNVSTILFLSFLFVISFVLLSYSFVKVKRIKNGVTNHSFCVISVNILRMISVSMVLFAIVVLCNLFMIFQNA